MKYTLKYLESSQLEKLHAGKVRESFRLDDQRRLIVVTDRLSAFNRILKNAIPHKGAVLNRLSNFWFRQTRHIIPNHFLEQADDQVTVVREAQPVRVEMIVRGYLSGHAWRHYQKGQRILSGATMPEGMKKNDPFPEPIITPTTKDKDDTDISPEEIIKRGIVSKPVLEQMMKKALALYTFGYDYLLSKGIILADTKYEFGIVDGQLHLIDEIHTPDSSRFWDLKAYEENSEEVPEMSKEYVRQWMLRNKENGELPSELPDEIVNNISNKYIETYERVTDEKFIPSPCHPVTRIFNRLLEKDWIKSGTVYLLSFQNNDFSNPLKNELLNYPVHVEETAFHHLNEAEKNKFFHRLKYALEPVSVGLIKPGRDDLNELQDKFKAPFMLIDDRSDLMLVANNLVMMFNTPQIKEMQ